jgi:putative transcriptional regulator
MQKRTISGSSRKPSSGKTSDPGTRERRTKTRLQGGSPGPTGTRLGRALVEGMTQVLAHVRGEIELKSYTLPVPINVKAIRRKVGMSQSEFASAFALNRRTLQEWEQGKTAPDNAVRAYLTVIERNPAAVVDALRRG